MAESSEDIESGSYRPNFSLWSEKVVSLEKKLREIAFMLALLEKAASTIGTMNFIWATVVLLGGFSTSLKSIDFWFVIVILVVEGLRILCRQGELATRRSSRFETLLIYVYSLLIQELSAIACIVLSSLRIHKQQYGSEDHPNRNRALNLFYWLSLVESSLTLLLFSVRMSFSPSPLFSLVSNADVRRAMDFLLSSKAGESFLQQYLGQRFCYDTYCRCMNGSVFDGLEMDFVSYSVELLQSIDHFDQLMAARLLYALVKSDRLTSENFRVIGTTPRVLARLIELLNWEKHEEQDIRKVAGEIICKLVETPRNRIRVMAIPESTESITSLLYDSNQIQIHSSNYQVQSKDRYNYSDFSVLGKRILKIHSSNYQVQSQDKYNYSAFSVLGKRILKILANDPENHAKIGTNKGLRKIIGLEHLNPNASVSEIIRHLESMPMETQQDVRENNNGTNGFEAEDSDDRNLQSVDSQV